MTIDNNSKAKPSLEKLELNGKNSFKTEDVSSISCSSDSVPKLINRVQPPKYPKYVFLIVLNQFCERFSFCGIRTILFIFLTSKN